MPMTVTFVYKTKHGVARNGHGHVVAQPAVPAQAALYVIRYKPAGQVRVYAGTSSNAQDRFNGRLKVYRESDLPDNVLQSLRFYIVKLKIDGQARTVNDQGYAVTPYGNMDVEHLFVRSIVARANCAVTNVAKWGIFTNPFNTRLDVEFEDFPINHPYVPNNDFSVGALNNF
jgi:hypothetical protein